MDARAVCHIGVGETDIPIIKGVPVGIVYNAVECSLDGVVRHGDADGIARLLHNLEDIECGTVVPIAPGLVATVVTARTVVIRVAHSDCQMHLVVVGEIVVKVVVHTVVEPRHIEIGADTGAAGVVVSCPAPDGRRGAAHAVVDGVAVLDGVVPGGTGGVDVGEGFLVCCGVAPLDGHHSDGLRVAEVAAVGTLQLEHIVLHDVLCIGIAYFPAELLVAVVVIGDVVALALVGVGAGCEVVDAVVGGYVDFIGRVPQNDVGRVGGLGAVHLHKDAEAGLHGVFGLQP